MAHAFTQSKKFAAILHLPELESGSHASSGIRSWKAGIIPLDHRCTIYTVGGVLTFVLFSRAMICRFRYSYKCICHSAGGLIVSHFLQPDASPEYPFSCYTFSLGVLEANAWKRITRLLHKLWCTLSGHLVGKRIRISYKHRQPSGMIELLWVEWLFCAPTSIWNPLTQGVQKYNGFSTLSP